MNAREVFARFAELTKSIKPIEIDWQPLPTDYVAQDPAEWLRDTPLYFRALCEGTLPGHTTTDVACVVPWVDDDAGLSHKFRIEVRAARANLMAAQKIKDPMLRSLAVDAATSVLKALRHDSL